MRKKDIERLNEIRGHHAEEGYKDIDEIQSKKDVKDILRLIRTDYDNHRTFLAGVTFHSDQDNQKYGSGKLERLESQYKVFADHLNKLRSKVKSDQDQDKDHVLINSLKEYDLEISKILKEAGLKDNDLKIKWQSLLSLLDHNFLPKKGNRFDRLNQLLKYFKLDHLDIYQDKSYLNKGFDDSNRSSMDLFKRLKKTFPDLTKPSEK